MGRWKALIPIVLALVIAIAGSFFLYQWVQKQISPQKATRIQTEAVPAAVAMMYLPWGTKLSADMIKITPYLRESLPDGYFSDKELLIGRVLQQPLNENELILESRLASSEVKTGGVSAVLTQGKRAIAVKGDKIIGISGFIRPGDRVDIIATMTDPETEKEVTKTILENILVLATGTVMEEMPGGKKGEAFPVDVYTLELTPEESEILALGASEAKLQFALRHAMDHDAVMTEGATVSKALSGFKRSPKIITRTKRSYEPAPARTIEVIKGGKVVKENVSN